MYCFLQIEKELVDHIQQKGQINNGIALYLGNTILQTNLSPQNIAEKISIRPSKSAQWQHIKGRPGSPDQPQDHTSPTQTAQTYKRPARIEIVTQMSQATPLCPTLFQQLFQIVIGHSFCMGQECPVLFSSIPMPLFFNPVVFLLTI